MTTYMLRWLLVVLAAYYITGATAGRALRSINHTVDVVFAQVEKAGR